MFSKRLLSTALLLFIFGITGCSQPSSDSKCIAPVVINEFVASNTSILADDDGDFEDWIELYNCTDNAIDLSGWGLSDNLNRPFKWVFEDTQIQPNEYLIIWASGKDRQQPDQPLHTNFKISASGEPLLLTRPGGETVDQIDAIVVPTDKSYGRYPDGGQKQCYFNSPSPGDSNHSTCFSDASLNAPIFSLNTGTYRDHVKVELTQGFGKNAFILYTLDGSIPELDTGNTFVYNSPITLNHSDNQFEISTSVIRAVTVVADLSKREKLENVIFKGFNHAIDLTNRVVWFGYRVVRKLTNYQSDYFNAHTFNQIALHDPSYLYGGSSIESFAILGQEQYDKALPFMFINNTNLEPVSNREDWITGSFTLNKTSGALEIKGRGNSTWGMPKKPYSIKLDTPESLLDMSSHRRWVLLQNYMDRTLLRNKVSLEISKRLDGLTYTPDSRFVELVLNGQHLGNYQLTEQIHIGKNRLNLQISPDDKKIGGHLLLLDTNNRHKRPSELSWESPIINTAQINPNRDALPYSLRRTLSADPIIAKQYLEEYVTEIETLLMSDFYGSDSILYDKYIDINSFIDYYILFELVRNGEPNHPKSVFMYQGADGKIYAGPAWDFDWGTFRGYSGWTIRNTLWYSRLFLDPYFVEQLKKRWNNALPALQEIPDFIDQQYAHLKLSANLNDQLWDISERTTNRDESMTFEDAIENMKEVYLKRLNWMNNEINSW